MRAIIFFGSLFSILVFLSCAGQDPQKSIANLEIKHIEVISRVECKPQRSRVMIRDVDSLTMFYESRKLDSVVNQNTLRVGQIGKNQFGFNEIIVTYSNERKETMLMMFTVFNGVLFEAKNGQYFINDHLAMLVENFIVND